MVRIHSSKKNQIPLIYSWVSLLVLMFLLVIFVRGAYASFSKKQTAEIQKQEYQQHHQDLEYKKEVLESKIQHLESQRGVEEELRKRFNVVKQGETVIRIVE